MPKHSTYLTSLRADTRAITALEYGIVAGVIGLTLITIFRQFGDTLSIVFRTIGHSI